MRVPNRSCSATRLAGVAAGACLLAAWTATCAEYDSDLLTYSHFTDGSAGDAASEDGPVPEEAAPPDAAPDTPQDSGTEAQPDSSAPCDPACSDPTLVRPPCPPTVADPPSTGTPLIFAMRTIRGGMSKAKMDDWKTIGLDLDCLATSGASTPSMCKPVSADLSLVEDGDQGRDNSFGKNLGGAIRLMELFGVITDDVEVAWNQSLEKGTSGLLFSIENYGGGADDPQVLVGVYLSQGVYDQAGTTELVAAWDGNDYWTIDRDSLSPLDEAKYIDDAAYVTNNRVVGHLPEGLPLKFTADKGVLELSLSKSVFVLELSPDHQHVVSGVLGGVWYTSAAVSALDSYAGQTGICPDSPEYAAARDVLSKASDIRVDLKPAPTLDCNGMSIGLAFTADPARLGAILDPLPHNPSLCGDAGTDAS